MPTTNTPEPPVYGMPLQELLTHVWFDGFTSGATTACCQFLPDDAADARADELAAAALKSPEIREQVQREIQDRIRELMQKHMANGKPIPGLKPSDLKPRQ